MSIADYKATAPKGYGGDPKRGAALGRGAPLRDLPENTERCLGLLRVHLNNGGYDVAGTYWGHGAPLFWCHYRDRKTGILMVDFVIRADDREDAKARVRKFYPNAKFRK